MTTDFAEAGDRHCADADVEVDPGEIGGFSFDLHDTPAPHSPLKIFWNRGLLAQRDLIHLDQQLVEASAGHFLENLDSLLADARERA